MSVTLLAPAALLAGPTGYGPGPGGPISCPHGIGRHARAYRSAETEVWHDEYSRVSRPVVMEGR